jgi:pyruvate,water dikinase
MYPLIANYLGFYGLCRELDLPPEDLPKYLQGYESQPMRADRALWQLANEARGTAAGSALQSGAAEGLYARLCATDGARSWLERFEAFQGEFGQRADRVVDVTSPSWSERPDLPLGVIRTLMQSENAYDFDSKLQLAVAEREQAIEGARSRLTRQSQRAFDEALRSCQHANFSWWNEDHNWYIDMRCTLPIRRAALAIAERSGFSDPADVFFLFYPELMGLTRGHTEARALATLISDRKDYFAYWDLRRDEMPKVLGNVPEQVLDPVMIEIFGITTDYLRTMKEGATDGVRQLKGIGASPGTVTGSARVLTSADQIPLLRAGEILVCEGTTSSWTPAFTQIAGCVCDSGGTLTHASIVSREYRVPCVVGTGLATQIIRTGDEVTIDGSRGIVEVRRRA